MKDITNILKGVISSNVDWSINFFFSVIERAKEKGFDISFWEGEENWASILVGYRTIGYIWKKHPLIIIVSQYASRIRDCLKENDITFIKVMSLTDKEFKLSYNELKDEIDFGLINEGFSAEDLWFHTNSV